MMIKVNQEGPLLCSIKMKKRKKIHIIAEAGTNHGGDIKVARSLVSLAKDAGADSVKFQIIYPEGLYLPEIYKGGVYSSNEVFNVRKGMMLADDHWDDLNKYASINKIPLSASVFDARGIHLLSSWNPPYIKIASCDLNYGDLLREAANYGKKIILSTGMSTLQEIEEAIGILEVCGHKDLVVMHCVSAYPCPVDEMNLHFINELKKFGYPLGLSDHTESNAAAIAAVALGVEYIEKHFTYDRKAKGFDHAYAMEPNALKSYIEDIRNVEKSLEPKEEKLSNSEKDVKKRARRSLYAARDISPGTILTRNDIITVRPGGALEPNKIDSIIGRPIDQKIRKFEAIPGSILKYMV